MSTDGADIARLQDDLAALEDREETRRLVLQDVIIWLGQRDMGPEYAGELCRRLNDAARPPASEPSPDAATG